MDSAGEKLKKIRLEKGLTLEEAQKQTKIHLNILKAIEGDGLTQLSPVYIKGFLKIYCKFLGVDPQDYIPGYKEIRAPLTNISGTERILEKPKKPLTIIKSASEKLGSLRPSPSLLKRIGLILIIIFLSLGLFNLGKSISAKRRTQLAHRNLTKKKQVAPPIKAPALTPKPQAPEIKAQKESFSGIRLGIRARENCWLSLKADGRMVFQRVLEKGRFESWQAKERMELAVGNAAAIELEVNGQLFSNLGRRGQSLKNIIITKEGLKIGR